MDYQVLATKFLHFDSVYLLNFTQTCNLSRRFRGRPNGIHLFVVGHGGRSQNDRADRRDRVSQN